MTDQEAPKTIEHHEQDVALPRLAKRWGRVDARGLEVQQVDIDNALRENSHSCMIADAIKRQFPELRNITVDMVSIRWTDPKRQRRVLCLTPMECQRALVSFDLGVKPKPFKFNLRSAQVTAVTTQKARVDDAGAVVRAPSKVRKYKRVAMLDAEGKPQRLESGKIRYTKVAEVDAAGEPVTYETTRPVYSQARPSRAAVLHNGRRDGAPHADLKVGGHMGPTHRPSSSRQRRFGVKGFTWEPGEDPEVIAERQRVAYGVAPDAS